MTQRSFAEIDPASDWCQRWNNQQHSWRHKSEGGFDRARYTVDLIEKETPAKDFVLKHHYSDTYPAAKWRFGLYEDRGMDADLVGVAVFSNPTNQKVLTNVFPDLVPYYASTELGRFVLLDAVPANAESFFLARCFEQLTAFGVHGIVSMSDPVQRRIGDSVVFAGHVGNMLPTGEILNRRAQQKVRRQDRGHEYVERKLISFGARPLRAGEKPNLWLREAKQAVGIRRVPHAGNHRYAFCLGNKTQRRHILVAPAQSPYPKEVDHAA